MPSKRWSQIERLYHAASALEAHERRAFLENACDDDIRREVESLLANDSPDDRFLEMPAIQAAAAALARDETASGPTLVGRTISHYRIEAELGSGGMGVVYQAEDIRLGRKVALKFLREDSSPRQAQSIERFQREARAASALNHPNICTIYDIGRHEGTPYIAMEYLEGRTLRQCLDEAPLKVPTIVDLAIQVADALAAAHAAGIIHRDIKPTNILVTTRGDAKILDFGLAKPQPKDVDATADLTITNPGMTVGTVAYMSPEQARGEEVDARSDLFSFGAVLYEMAARCHPFPGDSMPAILQLIVAEQPAPLRERNPEAPPELERIVAKALEKDRDLRYQSSAELRTDLKRLKRDSSSEGSPAGAVAAYRSRARGRRRLPAAILGTAVVAVGMLGWLQFRTPQPPRILEYRQLTTDAIMKSIAATDGVRLYLNENSGADRWAAQITVDGGEPARLPLPSPRFYLLDASPDGASLLAADISTYGHGPLWVVPALGRAPYRVGNLEAGFAAWSPDGKRIAYAKGTELFVAQNDGRAIRKLASAQGAVQLPAWAPDGKRLSFTVYDEQRQSSQIWDVTSDGSGVHRRFQERAAKTCCGRWTADGRLFVYWQDGQIWASAARTTWLRRSEPQPVQLTSGAISFGPPIPSKDGNSLFAVAYSPRGEVVRYDDRTRSFAALLPGVSADFVAYSSDGQWVAYVTFPDGVLWRSRTDQTERVRLTQLSPSSRVSLPRWSPDGSQVLYTLLASGQLSRAYVVPAAGGEPRDLSIPRGRPVSDANWSPDGSRICFDNGTSSTEGRHSPNIHVFDVRSGAVADIPGSEDYFSARWSPDGRYLAALSLDSSRLALFNFSTGQWREIGRGGFYSFPAWSHDSAAVYYIQSTPVPSVMRAGLDNRPAEQVIDLRHIHLAGFYGSSLSLTPDDQPVLTRDAGAQEVYQLVM